MFRIRCDVSGGVTGHRAAWLKNKDNTIAEFDTREDAQAEADKYNCERNANPYRTASFSYTVEEML